MHKINNIHIAIASAITLAGAAAAVGFYFYSRKILRKTLRPAIDPNTWSPFEVEDVKQITHNTRVITFKLPSNSDSLGLVVSSFLYVKSSDGKSKPYTPLSTEEEIMKTHKFELLVKEYPNGTVSKAINSLKKGDSIEMKGPFSKLLLGSIPQKNIGMIAGGTGITPMLQAINYLIANSKDTKMTLLFSNHSEADILLRNVLDQLEIIHPQLSVHHIITEPSQNWTGQKGHISSEAIKKSGIPPPSPNTLIFVCGPPGFMKTTCGTKNPDFSQGPLSGILADMGYTEDQVYKF